MISTRPSCAALLVFGLSWGAASASIATTIFATADRDTALIASTSGDLNNGNFGNGDILAVGSVAGGAERTIMSFGQSLATQIGNSAASITSVDLLLMPNFSGNVNLSTIPGGGLTPEVFALTSANSNWVEGSGTSTGSTVDAAANGMSTWSDKVYNTTPASAVAWAGSAGASTPLMDYTGLGGSPTTPWGSATVTSVTNGTQVDLHFSGTPTQLTALIEGMISAGASSAGFVLFDPNHTTDGSRLVTYSREDALAANRPMLEVSFIPVPEPGSFGLLGCGAVAMLCVRRIRRVKTTLAGTHGARN